MEACAFQDLTGQLIRKVTRLIRYLQENNLISTAELPREAPRQPDSDRLTREKVDQLSSGGKIGSG